MVRTILVPLDGSLLAERALSAAGRLARLAGARVLLVRCAPPESAPEAGRTGPLAQAQAYLEQAALRLREQGVGVETAVRAASPVDGIVAESAERHADLVVMSTHGRSGEGRWIYGSVAEGVLARGSVPTLLVRPNAVADDPLSRWRQRLLVPLDGSPLAEEALGPAAELARLLDGTIELFRVLVTPPVAAEPLLAPPVLTAAARRVREDEANEYLARIAARLRADGLRVNATVGWSGAPADAILEACRRGAGMVVMATHGRTGLGRLLFGTVAFEIVRRGTLPVLMVRPSGLETAARAADEVRSA